MSPLTLRPAMTTSGAHSVRELASSMGTPAASVRQLAQTAQLHTKYLQLGGGAGRMGWPLTATTRLAGGAVARVFEGGELQVADNGASLLVHERRFTVHFVGLECMRESSVDQQTPSDEPYVLYFVQSGSTITSTGRADFSKIDTGDKVVLGNNAVHGPENHVGVPFVINAVVIEWDSGDRQEAQNKVNQVIRDFVGGINEVIDQVNNYKGSNQIQRLPAPVNMPIVGGAVADFFGLEDDPVGGGIAEVFMPIPGETREQLNARIKPPPVAPEKFDGQASYSHVIHVVGNPAGRYKLYFRVDVVEDKDTQPL